MSIVRGGGKSQKNPAPGEVAGEQLGGRSVIRKTKTLIAATQEVAGTEIAVGEGVRSKDQCGTPEDLKGIGSGLQSLWRRESPLGLGGWGS